MKGDLKAISFLIKRFGRPYWFLSLALIIVSVIAGIGISAQPLVLAPALGLLEHVEVDPAKSLSDVTLNNLGPTMMSVLHLDTKSQSSMITAVGLLYLLVAVGTALLSFLSYILAIWLRSTISRDMARALHRKIQSLPLSFFHEHKTGDLISRYNNDVANTAYFIDSIARGILQSAVTIAVCFYILVRTSGMLALTVLAVGIIHVLVVNTLRRPVRRNVHRENAARGGLSSVLQESLSGVRTIKSFVAEAFDFDRIKETTESVRHNMLWNAFFKHLEEPLRLSLNAIAIVVVMLMSFREYLSGNLSISGFGLFLLLAQKTMEPTALLATHLLAFARMLGCSKRVLELFDAPNDLEDGDKIAEGFERELKIEALDFCYASRVDNALSGIDLTVKRGSMTALVGPSGGGKSTLADLVVRLCDPVKGRVLLDGVDIREFTQASYRSLFGIVPQECMLFNASIRENILLGRARDEQRFEQVMNQSHSRAFVGELPDGVDTIVGDRGVMLSGGQRQRIAIARAIYGNPSILVLDEATSALDSESEQHVQKAIEEIVKGMTVLVIAHRLSTVRQADCIVVLDAGRIEAAGTHEELLKNSAVYGRLCELQFGVETTGSTVPDIGVKETV